MFVGKSLSDHLKVALAEAAKQVEQYLALTEVLKIDAPTELATMHGRIRVWESNKQKGDDCPYELPQPGECDATITIRGRWLRVRFDRGGTESRGGGGHRCASAARQRRVWSRVQGAVGVVRVRPAY